MIEQLLDALRRLHGDGDDTALVWARGLRGYTVVGSAALLENTDGGDVDIVLLSDDPHNTAERTAEVLRDLAPRLGRALGDREAVLFVHSAVVPVLKIGDALDIQWLAGCTFPRPAGGDEADPRALPRYDDDDEVRITRAGGGPAADAVWLARLLRSAMATSPTFTADNVTALRRWAKSRHVYAVRFGYPGGSAWTVMLWSYCMYADRSNNGARGWDVVRSFLAVVATWPWPLPFCQANMATVVSNAAEAAHRGMPVRPPSSSAAWQKLGALEGTVGRHQFTNFVVPMPVSPDDGEDNGDEEDAAVALMVDDDATTTTTPPPPPFFHRVSPAWNMTQAVHAATHIAILHEAWAAAARNGPLVDYRVEMQRLISARLLGPCRMRWPLYFQLAVPAAAPRAWHGIVGSRLMATLLPQLEACGLHPRPLCVSRPSYLVLLWPRGALWATASDQELVLPLRERVLPALFNMLTGAYRTLCVGMPDAPALDLIMPIVDVTMTDSVA